ncbi:hypothetical protein FH063_000427 [Azospirillum argentinense]|uniref:Uncharacterized protein n=1 Tax=Azospirillum argentinense TaxID=2970906 RepID=A0A5B0KZT2_9PROT|nr:hypothetical protein FH063_000427 [Azospirillum argentinense]
MKRAMPDKSFRNTLIAILSSILSVTPVLFVTLYSDDPVHNILAIPFLAGALCFLTALAILLYKDKHR